MIHQPVIQPAVSTQEKGRCQKQQRCSGQNGKERS